MTVDGAHLPKSMWSQVIGPSLVRNTETLPFSLSFLFLSFCKAEYLSPSSSSKFESLINAEMLGAFVFWMDGLDGPVFCKSGYDID